LNYVIQPWFGKKEFYQASQIAGTAFAEDREHKRIPESKGLDSRLRHDLTNSVNVVVGFADLLSTETTGPLNQRQLRYVRIIRVKDRQMLGLVNSKSDRTSPEESSKLSMSPKEIPQQ